MTWTLGRLGRTELQLNVSALVILGLLILPGLEQGIWVRSTLLGVILIVSILVHELGHAWTAERYGLGPCRVLVHGFGGLCSFGERPDHRQGLVISLAGPAAGLLLGGAAWGVAQAAGPGLDGPMAIALALAVRINLFWSLFNLLPMFPLDGGQALRHLLHLRLPAPRAEAWTRRVGLVLGVAVAGWGLYTRSLFIGFIGLMVVGQNRAPAPETSGTSD